MKLLRIAILFFVLLASARAQTGFKNVSSGTVVAGISAVSLNTLTAKTFAFPFPFYDYTSDSLSGLFVFSIRQKSDDGKNYLNKAYIGAVDGDKDSIFWYSESNTFDIEKKGSALFFSSPAKSNKVNLAQGFEEAKYASRLLYTLMSKNRGLAYIPAGSEVVSCVNLSDGAVYWTANISGKENWVDAVMTKDSILVVAAAGLSAVDPNKGLQWSYPLLTAEKVYKALTFSLADNNLFIQNSSRVVTTSNDENSVTELSSNILAGDDGTVYFASKEKMIAVDASGKLLWELDLKAYPVSKMYLTKNGSSITLINFGLAKYADSYVSYGKAFVMTIDAGNGKMNTHAPLDSISNLVDFKETPKAFLFATRSRIVSVDRSGGQPQTLLELNVPKYGSFAEFVDGDLYHTEKEGFYVSLNFINDNSLYFRAENNKIYGTAGSEVNYEYHFNEIFRRDQVFDNKILLRGETKSLIISKNRELLATLNLPYSGKVTGNTLLLITTNQVHLLKIADIK